MNQLSTVCIDLDNTIIPWVSIWKSPRPFAGVRDAMFALQKQGYYIYILTSRMSNRWCEEAYEAQGYSDVAKFKEDQRLHIQFLLDLGGIPYDEIGAEKIPALAYMDDLAVRITPEYPLPAAIYDFIEGDRGK